MRPAAARVRPSLCTALLAVLRFAARSSPSTLQLLRPRPAGRPAASPAPDRPRNRAGQAGGARAADGRGREFAAGGVGSVSGRAAAEGGLGGARHGCARPRLVPTHAAILLSTRRLSCRSSQGQTKLPAKGRRSCQLCVTCMSRSSLSERLFPSKSFSDGRFFRWRGAQTAGMRAISGWAMAASGRRGRR